jgi:nicotinamide-nucleotide amidase
MKAVAGDDRVELAHVFRTALARADIVVLTGGLGPTDDDVTREVVAETLGRTLSEDPALTERMRARFAARGYKGPMPESNRRQAMVPAGARVIENPNGSAPGLWIEEGRSLILLLPGPPRELKPMLTALLAGPLRERAAGAPLLRRIVRMAGVIESQTDEVLQPLYREWSGQLPPISATILAALGQIELHLSTQAPSTDVAVAVLERAVRQACDVMGDAVFSSDGRSMEAVVGDMLVAHGYRIALAESCTGGLLASRLTDVAGSSRYVECGVVAYANAAKTDLLGVAPNLMVEHGAVSEPVAVAMAGGIRTRTSVDVGVGVTGIAGPGGGSAEKPVGTVAIAVVTPFDTRSRTFRFHGEREQVKFQASQAALDMVRRMLR